MRSKSIYSLVVAFMICLATFCLFAAPQGERDLISLSENVQFADAVRIFDPYYRQYENKVLLDMSDYVGPIGINLDRIHWKAAFNSILKKNELVLQERDNAFLVRKESDLKAPTKEEAAVEYIDDILIEATFFEIDFRTVRELGIDWSSFIGGRVKINADLSSTDRLTSDLLTVSTGDRAFDIGDTTIEVNALFKALASTNQGHFLATPQVTVSSGETGTVQDGRDFTILLAGITTAGTEVERAREIDVQSGTIVRVTPLVILDEEGEKAIKLNIKVERSEAFPNPTGYEKLTSEVTSFKTLYNGEETIIGGLTTSKTRSDRYGIPFLKDLPWWVFGIRYLTGYNKHEIETKELIILLKASILPAIHERKLIRQDVAEEIEIKRQRQPELEPKLLP
ncbi:MAG: type II and III secretion system protein [Candidatus Cloacimonetes bacterium]|nr:type II and III secretion system protein [Candidatus Cloacimonadota bacterium]